MSTLTPGFLRQVAADADAEVARLQAAFVLPRGGLLDREREENGFMLLARAAREAADLLDVRPKPTALELDRALVKRLQAIDDGLSEWEVGFVESISRWVTERELTPAQRERAEQIDGR